jgi:hypothetical protein
VSSQLPTFEPSEITRGETVAWIKSLPSYSPADGWALTYYFRGAGKGVDVVATDDGSVYTATMTAGQSLTLSAGRYEVEGWVSKGADETLARHHVVSRIVTVRQGLADVESDTPVDGRSQAERIVAEIDDLIERTLPGDRAEYTHGNRQKRHYSRAELLQLRAHYQAIVNVERRRARVKAGGSFIQTINARFKPL